MKEDLIKLYNTLKLISTKGDDTKIMGKCLEYTEAFNQSSRRNKNRG